MIFDLNGAPLTDDEYKQRLLAWTMMLVKAAGGRLEIPANVLQDLQGTRTTLTHEQDPATGSIILTVR